MKKLIILSMLVPVLCFTACETSDAFTESTEESAVEESVEPEEEAPEEEPVEEAEETEPEEAEPEETEEAAVEEIAEVETVTYEVTDADDTVYVYGTSSLNVRSGPGTENESIGVLSYGESVHRTGIYENGWCRIEYNGQTGCASGKYLTTEEPAASTAVTESSAGVYSDATATITVTKEQYAGSWCYIAHLQFTDYSRFGTACGNGTYGGYETTSHAASRLGAVFCVNGDYCTPSYGAPVARQGVVYSSGGHEDIAYYSSHTGILASPAAMGVSGTDLATLVANGTVTDTFCFLHISAGLVNGQVVHKDDTSRAQRTFIGTNGNPGDIYIVVSEGRKADGVSPGLTFDETMQLLQSKGCTFGLNLDGGGSSTMYFNGQVLNSASGNERSVVDFVFLR